MAVSYTHLQRKFWILCGKKRKKSEWEPDPVSGENVKDGSCDFRRVQRRWSGTEQYSDTVPVSYTHLCIRHCYSFDSSRKKSRCYISYGMRRLEKSMPRSWAVSYTHLDVYKRQDLYREKIPDSSSEKRKLYSFFSGAGKTSGTRYSDGIAVFYHRDRCHCGTAVSYTHLSQERIYLWQHGSCVWQIPLMPWHQNVVIKRPFRWM